MPATAHPGAGCDKCAQRRGACGDGWSSPFSLLEKSLVPGAAGVPSCQVPTREPDSIMVGTAGRGLSWGGCWALPGPWLAAFSPGWMCRALNYLLVLEAWHRWLPGSSTAPPCWRWDSSERRSELALQSQPFVLPLGSQTYLPSLSHVIGSGPDGSCLQFSMFPHL